MTLTVATSSVTNKQVPSFVSSKPTKNYKNQQGLHFSSQVNGKVTFSVQLYPYLHPFGALATRCEPQRSKAGGRNKTCGIKVRLFFSFFLFLSPSSVHLSELVSKSVGCAAFKRRPSRGRIHGMPQFDFHFIQECFLLCSLFISSKFEFDPRAVAQR